MTDTPAVPHDWRTDSPLVNEIRCLRQCIDSYTCPDEYTASEQYILDAVMRLERHFQHSDCTIPE